MKLSTRFDRVSVALGTLITAVVGLTPIGCARPLTTFEIVNYRQSGRVERFHETFDQAYYAVDNQGNIDVVLRTESPIEGDSDANITQLIYLHSFWRSIPGQTVADRTQLNGTVTYCVMSPSIVARFEGAGSLFFSLDKDRNELTGTLELARLTACDKRTAGDSLFARSELSGTFRAVRDPRRVRMFVNDIDRVFAPPRKDTQP